MNTRERIPYMHDCCNLSNRRSAHTTQTLLCMASWRTHGQLVDARLCPVQLFHPHLNTHVQCTNRLILFQSDSSRIDKRVNFIFRTIRLRRQERGRVKTKTGFVLVKSTPPPAHTRIRYIHLVIPNDRAGSLSWMSVGSPPKGTPVWTPCARGGCAHQWFIIANDWPAVRPPLESMASVLDRLVVIHLAVLILNYISWARMLFIALSAIPLMWAVSLYCCRKSTHYRTQTRQQGRRSVRLMRTRVLSNELEWMLLGRKTRCRKRRPWSKRRSLVGKMHDTQNCRGTRCARYMIARCVCGVES